MALTAVWEDRHLDTQSSDGLPDEVDVAVVGGGITGLTTALLLARAGRSVALLEARRIGGGTTGRSTAKVSVLQGGRLAEVRSRQPSQLLRAYVAANQQALDWVVDFADGQSVAYERRADHAYAVGETGARTARRVLEAATVAGLDAEWIDDPGLPFATVGAVRVPDQVQLDPLELVGALTQQARSHGVRIVADARVRKVRGRNPVDVRLTDGRGVRAGHVVVAIGMPMLDRTGFFARMTPARSYSLALTMPSEGPMVDGMYLSLDGPTRSLRDAPAAHDDRRVLLVGGSGHTTGRDPSPHRHLEELRDWTAEHFPGTVESHAWSAQDFMTHHGLPYAGPLLPGGNHVLVAGGFAKWGMTNGVAAAQAICAHILGDRVPWGEAFGTWSPHEVRGLTHGLVANGEVGFEMARSWVAPLAHPLSSDPGEGDGHVEAGGLGHAPVAASRVDGEVRRTSAVCTHLGGVVRWNDAEHSWDCPLHGSRFDPSGEVLEGPATCGLKPRR